MLRHVKHPFPAVINSASEILILGSVPSVKSVENNFYYMHPQNRFWRMLSCILSIDLTDMSPAERADALLSNHIALYDSVEECDILGSKDSEIINVIAADIPAILSQSSVQHIFCNGNASYSYLTSFYPELKAIATVLPSTSPANAQYSLSALTERWQQITEYINKPQ